MPTDPIPNRIGIVIVTYSKSPVMASGLDSFISPHVILPALLCLVLICLFLWNDRQNRRRKP
jgi:hypothetical protein